MPESQYSLIRQYLTKIKLPTSTTITQESFDLYEEACDVCLMYRGDPEVLIRAIQMFLATGTLAYAYAGIAKAIFAASTTIDGKTDPEGLRAGIEWLAKAQHIADSRLEIDVLEFDVYAGGEKAGSRRALLDKLRRRFGAVNNFRLAAAEMRYWSYLDNLSQVVEWTENAFNLAQNDIQRLYILNALADIYTRKPGYLSQALDLYNRIIGIDSRNAWAWHNMSVLFLRIKEYERAEVCNERALRLQNFAAAREVQAELVKRWSAKRNADIVDDIPPYTPAPTPNQPPRLDPEALFKKLFSS